MARINVRPGETIEEALRRTAIESTEQLKSSGREKEARDLEKKFLKSQNEEIPISSPYEFRVRPKLNIHCSLMVSIHASTDTIYIFTKERARELETIIKGVLLKGWKKTLIEELKEINPKLSTITITNSYKNEYDFSNEGDTIIIGFPYHNKQKAIKEVLATVFTKYEEKFKQGDGSDSEDGLQTEEEIKELLEPNPRVSYSSMITDIFIEETEEIEPQIVLFKGQKEVLTAKVINPEDIDKYIWGVWNYTQKELIFKKLSNTPELKLDTNILDLGSYNIQCIGVKFLGEGKYQKIQNQGNPIGKNKKLIISSDTRQTAPLLQVPFLKIRNAKDPEDTKNAVINTNKINLEIPISHANLESIKLTTLIIDKEDEETIEQKVVELNKSQIKTDAITGTFNIEKFNRRYEIKVLLEGRTSSGEPISAISSINVFSERPEYYEFVYKKKKLKLQLSEIDEINEELLNGLQEIISDNTLEKILKLNPKLELIKIKIK